MKSFIAFAQLPKVQT